VLRIKRVSAPWKPASQMVQVLIVYYQKGKKPASFSTDGSLSVEDILTRIAARCSLETLFRDAKEHLGLEQW
jgi:hypothetical protein